MNLPQPQCGGTIMHAVSENVTSMQNPRQKEQEILGIAPIFLIWFVEKGICECGE